MIKLNIEGSVWAGIHSLQIKSNEIHGEKNKDAGFDEYYIKWENL